MSAQFSAFEKRMTPDEASKLFQKMAENMVNNYNNSSDFTYTGGGYSNTTGTGSTKFVYPTTSSPQPSKPKKKEPDGPLDWLDSEVEEVCERGREALAA